MTSFGIMHKWQVESTSIQKWITFYSFWRRKTAFETSVASSEGLAGDMTRSVVSSLSFSKAMLPLTERVRQSTFWNETLEFISSDLLPPNSTDLNPVDYKNIARNAAAGLARSWRRWNEAQLDQCLAWFRAKRHPWRSYWVAQMSLSVNLCEKKTFWAFRFNSGNASVVLHILFVNFVNIKQMLLC